MDNESQSSETNLIIITKRDRAKLFCKIYWRMLIIIITPIILFPVACVGENNIAYKCFYIFLVTSVYWIGDVMHPAVIALVPMALFTIFGYYTTFVTEIYLRSGLATCLGVMMIMVAIEHSKVNRRIALKLLLLFGCSHYRLSFLLFFSTMFLSMWVTTTLACGLMMPLVMTILTELEKMGILEVFQSIGKATQKTKYHEESVPRPSDFTVFYFLGIAYSSSIGGMCTLIGSRTSQHLKYYWEHIFPSGPIVQFPDFMLLTLPGILLIETLVYLWMNSYFLGMFRAQSEIALEIGMSQDEAQYIQTLLTAQYHQLGSIKSHEIVVLAVITITVILQAAANSGYRPTSVSCPTLLGALLLLILPSHLDFLNFFKHGTENTLPRSKSKSYMSWALIRNNIPWGVLMILAGSCTTFESLRTSGMTEQFEEFLLVFRSWPAPANALVVIIFCKLLTEMASNSCVVHTILPTIAKVSVSSKIHPHYLMLAATLASSVPFHMVTGSAPNALVKLYVHIPHWKMMRVGVGPSLIAIVIIWFITTVWSKAIWPDINVYPEWANDNIFVYKNYSSDLLY